jgi:hypothetical protein
MCGIQQGEGSKDMLRMVIGPDYTDIHGCIPAVESYTAEKQSSIRPFSNIVAAISDSAGERIIGTSISDENISPSAAGVFQQLALGSQSMPLRGLSVEER